MRMAIIIILCAFFMFWAGVMTERERHRCIKPQIIPKADSVKADTILLITFVITNHDKEI